MYKVFTKTNWLILKKNGLSEAANIEWDLSKGNVAHVVLTDNRTLDNPQADRKEVGNYTLIIEQGNSGGKSLTFSSLYKFPNATQPSLNTSPNSVSVIEFVCDGTYMYYKSHATNM